MAITLERVRARADTVMVPMNATRSGPWSSNLQFLATEGLNGCTAIAILSNKAGILAHVAPRTPTADGEQNIRALMQLVIQHYNTQKREGLFPDSTTSIILAAVYDGSVALPSQINTTRAVLAKLGLPITSRQYRVREQGEIRTAGETSMIIYGRKNVDPHIYVNDELIAQKSGTHEIKEAQPAPSKSTDTRHSMERWVFSGGQYLRYEGADVVSRQQYPPLNIPVQTGTGANIWDGEKWSSAQASGASGQHKREAQPASSKSTITQHPSERWIFAGGQYLRYEGADVMSRQQDPPINTPIQTPNGLVKWTGRDWATL